MKRKKILLYSMALIKGGTERTIANLSNYFIEQYDIIVVSNINHSIEYRFDPRIKMIMIDKIDRYHENTVKKIFTKLGPSRSIQLKNIIQEEKPDLILTFLPEPTIRVLKLKREFPTIPIIVCIRNHPKKEYVTPIGKLFKRIYFPYADCIIVQDEHFINYLSNHIHNKLVVIPNYISESFLHTKISKTKKNKIVTITRLEKQKNIPLLIHSYMKLNPKYHKYKLYIYGEGKEKDKINQKIQKNHLEKNIILCGNHSNISEEIKDASLFILPSNYEGMPNSILEAMSLGIPVITTDSSEAISTIITNSVNGIIVPKKNQKELTYQIEKLLKHKKRATSIGNNATLVRNKYNKENIIQLWENIIHQFIS